MKSFSPLEQADARSLAEAMARGALDQAEYLLSTLRTPWSPDILPIAGELHLRKRRWQDAAECLGRIEVRDVGTEMRRRMVVNLAALQVHRPEVYQILLTCPGNPRYTIGNAANGLPVNLYQQADGRQISLTSGNNPLAALAVARRQLKPNLAAGETLALLGLGDGYLLHTLAHEPPKLFPDTEQVLYLLEPEPQIVLNCLMMHDYTGPMGAIEQKRINWFIGAQWQERMTQAVLDDLYLPLPGSTVSQSVEASVLAAKLDQVRRRWIDLDQVMRQEVERKYAPLQAGELAEVFSSERTRRPRVLLLTTRFSTVPSYSTRDSAEAFEQIGCETRTLIEPTPHHRLSRPAIRAALASFQPDLVFQIDHLRCEHGNLFPPQLPFACWIQDHLPNLTNDVAGSSVGARDFILSSLSSYFVRVHKYPRRQMLDLPQLGRVPIRPTDWKSNGDDLAYVSNWSRTISDALGELRARWGPAPEFLRLIDQICGKMIRHYHAGGSISTCSQVRELLVAGRQEVGVKIPSAQTEHLLVESIFDRLNNTLYRHQALGWAAEIARELGLTFSLYGRGWEAHPKFAEYARGPVAGGAALEDLTRRTRLNLQVEPNACFTHTRLLSGLFAGGFFLVRDHPFNHLSQELVNFLAEQGCASADCNQQARDMIDPAHKPELEELLHRCRPLEEQGDCIELMRNWERARVLVPGAEALPRMKEITFDSRVSLLERVTRFLSDDDGRHQIVYEQRLSTESRLSYVTGLRRVLRQLSEKLSAEAATVEVKKCA